MHNIFHHCSAPYLNHILHQPLSATSTAVINISGEQETSSADVLSQSVLQVSRTWNSLPFPLRLIDSHAAFRRALKRIFTKYYNDQPVCLLARLQT